MASYHRDEVVIRRVRWVVPCGDRGACWADVWVAMELAVAELRERAGQGPEWFPPDDAIRVVGAEDAVIVFYQVDGEAT